MATERQERNPAKTLEKGLKEYMRIVSAIPSVAAIVVVPGPERDLFTYIDERDEGVLDQIADVEDELFRAYDEVLFDFHVIYLQGRPLKEMAPTSGKQIYLRSLDA